MPDRKLVMSHMGRGKMYYFGGVEEGGGQQAPGSGNAKMRLTGRQTMTEGGIIVFQPLNIKS